MKKILKQLLTSSSIAFLSLFIVVLLMPIKTLAQEFYQVTRDTSCIGDTFRVGQVIPANSFASLSACNSYIQSFIDFYENNVLPTSVDPDSTDPIINPDFSADAATWCGGQAQFACTTDAETGCDTGYVITELGSCVARAADDRQYVLFRECTEDGGIIESCERLAFGGREYLESEEAAFVQDCMDAITEIGYNFDPEYCQAAVNLYVYDSTTSDLSYSEHIYDVTTGATVAGCINNLLQDLVEDCAEVNLQGFNYEVSVGATQSNQAESIATFIDYCESSKNSLLEDISCLDLAYQLNEDGSDINTIASNTVETCIENSDATDDWNLYDVCQPILETINIVSSEVAQTTEPVETTSTIKPPAVSIPPTAIAYISMANSQSIPETTRQLNECTATATQLGLSQSQCEIFMKQFVNTNLTGQQIARCINQPDLSYCPEGKPVTAQVTISQSSSEQLALNQQVTITVASIEQQIADCAQAGASREDCKTIIIENEDASLTGRQVGECIQNVNTNGSCRDLAGIDEVSYSACTTLGACVEGRTCIYQGSKVLRNVGAKCNDSPQVSTCEPIVDKFSENGKETAPCCGGGLIECSSGLCNAAPGLKGKCTAVQTNGSVASNQSSEASVGVGDETQLDCTKATGLVQGTAESGFTLKCDFDGNGSYGYHQPTGFIKGNQAVGVCQTLCSDPTIDVEAASRSKYQAVQIAVARAKANDSAISFTDEGKNLGENALDSLKCKIGTFESSFACVSWYKGACIEQADGCYREATREELPKVCAERSQQTAYDCSFASRETCLLHPETGCYAPKSNVYKAEEVLAAEIKAGQQEITTVSQVATISVIRRGAQFVENIGVEVANIWGQITGTLLNSQPIEDAAEETPTDESAEELESNHNSNQNQQQPGEPQLLTGATGLVTGKTLEDGEVEVEAYCSKQGYGTTIDTNDDKSAFVCEDEDGNATYTLYQIDYDRICSETYGENAIAVQNGTKTEGAYNWLCYSAN